MEGILITPDNIILWGKVIAALGTIGGVVAWCIKFVDRQKQQDKEIAAIRDEQKVIRSEQTLICYGLMACLRGLKEQGCNGSVTEILARFEKHLNVAAHESHIEHTT